MKLEIHIKKAAKKFLLKNSTRITFEKVESLAIQAAANLLGLQDNSIDLRRLKPPFSGLYRIRSGSIRIVISLKAGIVSIVTIHDINFRGSVY